MKEGEEEIRKGGRKQRKKEETYKIRDVGQINFVS